MREGHEEAPGDIRAFLPRPGEPVEAYAERLRALHRDLTLVLEAVERGLAAADQPESDRSHARQEHAAVESVTFPVPGRGPRVEVMAAPSGVEGRVGTGDDPRGEADRRRPAADVPAPDPEDPRDDVPAAGRPFPARPSSRADGDGDEPREPAWVEAAAPAPHGAGEAWQPVFSVTGAARPAARVVAAEPPPGPPRTWTDSPTPDVRSSVGAPSARMAPLLVALMITGWLIVAALAIALLIDGA